MTALALSPAFAEQAGLSGRGIQRGHRKPAEIGGEPTANPTVRKAFTGSTGVGRLLMAQCAPTIKTVAGTSAVTHRLSFR